MAVLIECSSKATLNLHSMMLLFLVSFQEILRESGIACMHSYPSRMFSLSHSPGSKKGFFLETLLLKKLFLCFVFESVNWVF